MSDFRVELTVTTPTYVLVRSNSLFPTQTDLGIEDYLFVESMAALYAYYNHT